MFRGLKAGQVLEEEIGHRNSPAIGNSLEPSPILQLRQAVETGIDYQVWQQFDFNWPTPEDRQVRINLFKET